MAQHGGPRPQSRLEDDELLRGRARFLDDLPAPSAWATFVRSPIAAGRIVSIDVSQALDSPGVLIVLTGDELGLGRLQAHSMLSSVFDRPPLAVDEVRFVGEPVMVVVATSRAAATDALQLVDVRYETRAGAFDTSGTSGTAVRFDGHDSATVFEKSLGSGPEVHDGAAHVISNRSDNQRVATAPIEPDGAQAEPTPDGGLLVWSSTQRVHHVRTAVAESLALDPDLVRVRAPNVGGGFGGKFEPSPETVVVAAVARRLGRSVRWVQTRTENLQTMPHGRAQRQHASLGLEDDGRFRSLWIDVVNDAGAYPMVGAVIPMATSLMSPGCYAISRVGGGGRAVGTNRAPLGAYRGAGRPEATAMLERLIDIAARELDIDPVELRRRNLIGPSAFPHTSATGMTYDSGDYPALLDDVVERIDYAGVRARQTARTDGARVLGVGIAMWLDCTPMNRPGEYASIDLTVDDTRPSGVRAMVRDGANDQGQAHRTTWALLIGRASGLPIESIDLGLGDTDEVPTGEGTGSARSMMLAGGAVAAAADLVVEQARSIAAHLLEASPDDIVPGADGLSVAGTPARTISWAEVVRAGAEPGFLPGELADRIAAARGTLPGTGIGAAVDFVQSGPTFPSGCNGAVVEVDTETGEVALIRFVAVDDCGTIVNAPVVEGQQHGGIAQGIAQALYEEIVYDDAGNLLTSTFAEYGIPSAADLPPIEASVRPTPSPVNPLGVKGIGQGGAIGSTVAVQNAVVDALARFGVRHIDLPLTPERVWRAINDAGRAASTPPPRPG